MRRELLAVVFSWAIFSKSVITIELIGGRFGHLLLLLLFWSPRRTGGSFYMEIGRVCFPRSGGGVGGHGDWEGACGGGGGRWSIHIYIYIYLFFLRGQTSHEECLCARLSRILEWMPSSFHPDMEICRAKHNSGCAKWGVLEMQWSSRPDLPRSGHAMKLAWRP